MADTKISALPASTTPLAGTEVLPIVQSSTTKQVSVANLTAGRDIAATSLTTAAVQATNSGGLTLKNSSGTAQLSVGAGGGDNVTLSVATNITPANAAVAISPTGTGTVAISPAGALTINPTTASTINNVSIGATTALAGRFTTLNATTSISVNGNQAVNGPAFSAGLAPSNQSVSASTATKITIDTEDFDTNGNYDPTTNYRFTPTVGGYYQISAGITTNAAASGTVQALIYKNGSLYKSGSQVILGAATATTVTVSCLVNMNGSSDYVELYCFQSSAAALLVFTNSTAATWFQGSMVRGL